MESHMWSRSDPAACFIRSALRPSLYVDDEVMIHDVGAPYRIVGG